MGDDALMQLHDPRRYGKHLVLLGCMFSLFACSTPARHYARSFVNWDALSEAANAADQRCGGKGAELIAGRAGYSRDDYRCASGPDRNITTQDATRMMFVPQSNGSVTAVPVHTGAQVPNSRAGRSSRPRLVPGSQTIARIESGSLLLELLRSVGVADTASMNRESRVKVRGAECTAQPANRATCTYETDRCRGGEPDKNEDGWCRRQTRFVRTDVPLPTEPNDGGWTMDRVAMAR